MDQLVIIVCVVVVILCLFGGSNRDSNYTGGW